jgi:hypothetical protein
MQKPPPDLSPASAPPPARPPGRLTLDFSKDRVEFVREIGTAGSNRMWDQFLPTDKPLALPIYHGRIDPPTWKPKSHTQHKGENA